LAVLQALGVGEILDSIVLTATILVFNLDIVGIVGIVGIEMVLITIDTIILAMLEEITMKQ
jgi:hypothetical protein